MLPLDSVVGRRRVVTTTRALDHAPYGCGGSPPAHCICPVRGRPRAGARDPGTAASRGYKVGMGMRRGRGDFQLLAAALSEGAVYGSKF